MIAIKEARNTLKEYERVTVKVCHVCDLLNKNLCEKTPVCRHTIYVAQKGIMYPENGWTLIERNGIPSIQIEAWDGFDGESYSNTTVDFPFDWINTSDDKLIRLIKGEDHV